MNIVYVHFPKIKFDTVTFNWNSTIKVPFFKRNNFYIRYEGINIEKMPIEYFWYSFLSVIIPVFSYCNEDVILRFPSGIPSDIAKLWINYHNANNIYIYPLIEKNSNTSFENTHLKTNIGVLFGGGKDSTYALSVLNEIYGTEHMVLISYVLPYMDNIFEKHDKRRDTFVLNPLKEKMNIKVQKIYSNFFANLTSLKYKYSTHIAVYLGPLIPVLLEYGISSITYSYEFTSYRTGFFNSEDIVFNYRRSRPETSKYVSELTSIIINKPINIVNFNYYISEIAAFKVLAQRYPENLRNILMCENITDMRKWCQSCTKCGTYVFCSMYFGSKYIDINLNRFFENSGYIKKLITNTENLVNKRNEDNNCPWIKEFCPVSHFDSLCHIIASIDIDKFKQSLSNKAFSNLEKVKERYGNKKYPIYECFIDSAFNKVSPPIPEEVKHIVTKYCPSSLSSKEYVSIGNDKGVVDYSLECNIPSVFSLDRNNNFCEKYFN